MECPKCFAYSLVKKLEGRQCQSPNCTYLDFENVTYEDELPPSEEKQEKSRGQCFSETPQKYHKSIKDAASVLRFCQAIWKKVVFFAQKCEELTTNEMLAYLFASIALEKDIYGQYIIVKYFKIPENRWIDVVNKGFWEYKDKLTHPLRHTQDYYLKKYARKLSINGKKLAQIRERISFMSFGGQNPKTIAAASLTKWTEGIEQKILKLSGMNKQTIKKCLQKYYS